LSGVFSILKHHSLLYRIPALARDASEF